MTNLYLSAGTIGESTDDDRSFLSAETLLRLGMTTRQLSDWIDRGWLTHWTVQPSDNGDDYFKATNAEVVRGDSHFLMTPTGAEAVLLRVRPADAKDVPKAQISRPRRDVTRRALWYDGQVQRRYRRIAENQFMILDAFESAAWPAEIIALSLMSQVLPRSSRTP